jgi:hypothetical protein
MPFMGEPLKYQEVVERIRKKRPVTRKLLDLAQRQVFSYSSIFLNKTVLFSVKILAC